MIVVNMKNVLYGEVEAQWDDHKIIPATTHYDIKLYFPNGENVLLGKFYQSQYEAEEALKNLFI